MIFLSLSVNNVPEYLTWDCVDFCLDQRRNGLFILLSGWLCRSINRGRPVQKILLYVKSSHTLVDPFCFQGSKGVSTRAGIFALFSSLLYKWKVQCGLSYTWRFTLRFSVKLCVLDSVLNYYFSFADLSEPGVVVPPRLVFDD